MKKIFYFLSALTFILIIGCSKNNNLQIEKEQTIVLPDVNLTEIVENFDLDMASFTSYNEFASFTKKFNEISYEEQHNILNTVEFETIDEILDGAYVGMNDLETREEFIEYLKQYEQYLELVELPNGEEEVKEKEITGHTIYSFLNADKIIKIGNTYHKYFSQICALSENKGDLLKLNTSGDVINSGLKYYTAHSDNFSEIDSNEIELRWGEINKFHEWEKENDKFWCKNKRKVRFMIGIGREWIEPYVQTPDERSFSTQYLTIYSLATVTAKRKGIPCIWYKYKTTVTWNDFYSEYDIILDGVYSHRTWNGMNVTRDDVYGFRRYKLIAASAEQGGIDADCQWTIIKSNITTRGIWDKWLKVNWIN